MVSFLYTDSMQIQWNPSVITIYLFQKRWPFMRGKINMICKEWCMELDQILQPQWDIPGVSRGFHCIWILSINIFKLLFFIGFYLHLASQLALRRWPNVGIGRHRRNRQPTSHQRWYSVACVATVCWHSVGARRLAYRSLPMFCVWTSVVGIKCFSNKCCRSTRLSIHQLHI